MGCAGLASIRFRLLACVCLVGCSDSQEKGEAAAGAGGSGGGTASGAEVCSNGLDDDGDGEPDCSDPDCLAAVADPTQPAAFADTVGWLYASPAANGCAPLQQGVAAGALVASRVSVVRGRVSDAEGRPLAGAEVRVVGAPELGQARSRGDGVFDIAVNGGGKVTLQIGGSDYLPVHRRTGVPMNDYAWVEPVVLKLRSATVTQVDLASGQAVRAEASTDASGQRAPVVLFPAGTAAEAESADGLLTPLNALSVRLTEFTVGERGPEAMPADLPVSSAYTYAFEIGADEADALGANTVRFDRPLPVYLENFLGFPAGTPVPVGYYDRQVAEWKAEQDGAVVAILAEVNGAAELDLDGDGTADDARALDSAGVTAEELRRVAELYEPGQTLWRVPIEHFSAFDFNFPFGFPKDVASPPELDAPSALSDTPGCASGSILRVDNQTLAESVGIAGTGYQLFYQSDRAPGGQQRSLDVEVAGAAIPASLKRIDALLSVAGQLHEVQLEAKPFARFQYTWDGTNAYGRPLQGGQPYLLRISYVYDGVYTRSERGSASTFGQPGVLEIFASRTRAEVYTVREVRGTLGGRDARANGLGGFSLNVHHAYDPAARTLYYGDGNQRSAETVPPIAVDVFPGTDLTPTEPLALADGSLLFVSGNVIYRLAAGEIAPFAGGGTPSDGVGDRGPALGAALDAPRRLQEGPDSSVYFWSGNRIRRIDPAGQISSVLGGGTDIATREGKLATELDPISPGGLAVRADGVVYFGERADGIVWRIDARGRVERFAGGVNDRTEGQPARGFAIGDPIAIAFGPDGSLYIAGYANGVWRVDPDGIITTIAGRGLGFAGSTGDGGPAREATLDSPRDIAVDAGGTVFVAETIGRRIRSIDTDGVIHTFLALNLADSLSIGRDGAIYAGAEGHVYRIAPSLPGATFSDFLIASEDGSEVYRFDSNGRHLATVDALSGAERRRFEYDDTGRLAAVVEDNRRNTRIERNADGTPAAIVGPYGVRTALALNAEGYLASATDAAGQSVALEYAAGGLLTAMVDERGGRHEYAYEGNRLVSDRDPSGGVQTLAASKDGQTASVTLTSPLGRVQRHERILSEDGLEQRTTTPGGATSSSRRDATGNLTLTAADGTSIATVFGADPRFGAVAPLSAETTVKLPSGKASVVTQAAIAELANSADPLSVIRLQSETQINGRAFTSEYDAAKRTLVQRSAAGRELTRILDAQGRMIEQRVPGLLSTFYEYDADSRLVAVTSGSGADARRMSFEHSAEGWLATVTDALGQSTRYGADAIGRTTSAQYADGTATSFAYDAASNLTALTPPNQPPHHLEYDTLNLLSAYLPPELASGATPTRYAYDADHALTSLSLPGTDPITYAYSPAGLLSSVQHAAGGIALTYDSAERLVGSASPDAVAIAYDYDGALPLSTRWSGPVAGSVERAYDENFFVTTLSVNGVGAVTYTYDDDGLITQAGPVALAYDPANALLLSSDIGNVTATLGYSPRGELTTQSVTAGATPLYAVTHTYDPLGRIATSSETIAGTTTELAYTYDSIGQLTQATTDGTPSAYTYDPNGNRLTAPTASATYDAQDRLLSSGDATYTYSARGTLESRTTAGATTSFTYDALGNLNSVTLPDTRTLRYLTDAENRRVAKLVDGTLQRAWLYQDSLKPIAELDANGFVVSRFIYASRSNVPDVMLQGDTTYALISDLLGSVRLVVDTATGEVAQRIDYGPFGEVLSDSNPGFQPFGFAGGLYDPDTGLVRFGARDYDASVGRWLSKDPIGFSGDQINLYAYVGNDPVNLVDPTGEIANFVWQAAIGAIMGGAVDAGVQYLTKGCVNGSQVLAAAATGALVSVGIGAAVKAVQAARGVGSLIHFTDAAGAAGIASSGQIIGRGGIFALPTGAAGRGAFGHAVLTGLSPAQTTTIVSIPSAAASAFRGVVPVGPYSLLKALGGVHFSAPGAINLATGAFTQTGSAITPYAAIYGLDALLYGTSAGTYVYLDD